MSHQSEWEKVSTATRDAATEPAGMPSSSFRAARRVAALVIITYFYLAVHYILALGVRDDRKYLRLCTRLVRRWANASMWALNLRYKVEGEQPPEGSLLTPNHHGYTDIFLFAAVHPLFFVSKQEIADMPVVGFLFRRMRQMVVSRKKRAKDLLETNRQVRQRLEAGFTVCVFLEGTSTGGDRVLPFLTSLLQPAYDAGAKVVPVGVHWTGLHPEMKTEDDVAYWGGHHMGKHAWRLFGLPGAEATVRFGEPVDPTRMKRTELAEYLRQEVLRLKDE